MLYNSLKFSYEIKYNGINQQGDILHDSINITESIP